MAGVEFNQFEHAVKSIKETENVEVVLSSPRSRMQNEVSSLYPATQSLQNQNGNDSF